MASRSKPDRPPRRASLGPASMRTKRAAARPTSARSKASPPEHAGAGGGSVGRPTSVSTPAVHGTSGDGVVASSAFANTGYTPAQPA